jgi:hypothetical protein
MGIPVTVVEASYNASGIGRAAYLEAFCSSFIGMPVTVVEARL